MARTIRRRRLEAKTDYKSRLALLKSNKPRLVIRKTNKYVIAQLVISEVAQDKPIITLSSKDLLAKGWPKEKAGSLKSLAASYCLGLLIGKKAKEKTKEAILDIGMYRNVPKSRIYAVLKGVLDSGLNIPHNPDALPSKEMLESNPNTRDILIKLKDKL